MYSRAVAVAVLAACAAALAPASAPAASCVVTTCTIAGVSFDTNNRTTTLGIVTGGYSTTFGTALWSDYRSGTHQFGLANSLGTYVQAPTFQSNGVAPQEPDEYSSSVAVMGAFGSFVTLGPDPDTVTLSGFEITHSRDAIRLSWGTGNVLDNTSSGTGDDLVIFEGATSEAYMVRVHDASAADDSTGWTGWRYTVFDPGSIASNSDDGTATLIDLSDFSISASGAIDLLEIENMLPADAVDNQLGTFGGVKVGDGWVTLNSTDSDPIRPARLSSLAPYKAYEHVPGNNKFDPDIQYVAALHGTTITFSDEVSLPEPASALVFGLGLLVLARTRRRNARTQ